MHDQERMPLRKAGRVALPLLAAFAVGLLSSVAAKAQELKVGSWGGIWDDTVKEAVVSKFTEATGATVSISPGTSADQFAKLIASGDNPPFDVLYIDLDAAAAGFERGMFRKLDPAVIPNLANVYPNALYGDGQAVAASFGAVTIVYDSNEVAEIDSWKVFFDPAHSGHYGLNSVENWMLYVLPVFAKADGGDPADLDAGFAAVAKVAPGAAVSSGDFNLRPSFASGEIAFAPMYSGEAFVMYSSGQDSIRVAKPVEGMVAVPNLLVIPAKARQPELAEKFINAALEESAQRVFAEKYASAPSVQKVELPAELTQWMPVGAAEVGALITPDWVSLNARRDALVERWNSEIVPLVGTK